MTCSFLCVSFHDDGDVYSEVFQSFGFFTPTWLSWPWKQLVIVIIIMIIMTYRLNDCSFEYRHLYDSYMFFFASINNCLMHGECWWFTVEKCIQFQRLSSLQTSTSMCKEVPFIVLCMFYLNSCISYVYLNILILWIKLPKISQQIFLAHHSKDKILQAVLHFISFRPGLAPQSESYANIKCCSYNKTGNEGETIPSKALTVMLSLFNFCENFGSHATKLR